MSAIDFNLSLKANKIFAEEILEKLDDYLPLKDFRVKYSELTDHIEESVVEIPEFRNQLTMFKKSIFHEI
jgi:hypothetical protein